MAQSRILDVISSPANLKLLDNEELEILAGEIRAEIVRVTSKTGGHVASSLGAVEIILAAQSLLNCPEDKLVFDVGHQSYAHKLITGRLSEFETLRAHGGISGFPKPSESAYDAHPSGHASDSLSVALGLAKARDLRGGNEKIVAIIGDAALSGGMAFEALNHIGQAQTPMVIILNDNEMSISRNVGALMKHLGYMRASNQYRQTRDKMQERMEKSGAFGSALTNFGRNAKESLKQFVIPRSMIFEQLGIICTAPIDGHNIAALRETLQTVLATDAPVLMHVVTKKGKGFEPAEKNPERFHGIGPYNPETGEPIKHKALVAGRVAGKIDDKSSASSSADCESVTPASTNCAPVAPASTNCAPVAPASTNCAPIPTYTEVFGEALVREASQDEDIVAITAAMKSGTGLSEFATKFPDRFIDTGIAEEHAVGLASGLAAGGKKPVVAIYSTFLQRAIDQMIINCALPDLDVVFAIDRAGVVGEDGSTHHGLFDIAYARAIPNMRVLTPSNEAELVSALHTALAIKGPVALRYPRGQAQGVPIPKTPEILEVGRAHVVREATSASCVPDVAILAFGHMVESALEAADVLASQNIDARVVDMRWAKPLDEQEIEQAACARLLVTIEEGILAGGAGQGVSQVLIDKGLQIKTLHLGIPDMFVGQGKSAELLRELGLDASAIASSIKSYLG